MLRAVLCRTHLQNLILSSIVLDIPLTGLGFLIAGCQLFLLLLQLLLQAS